MQAPLILLIDDSPTIRKMVEHHLALDGYRVALAADAETGLELAMTQPPDLIILDHQLPGINGVEVCKHLLASDTTSRIPVLISSSLRSKAFAQYSEFPNVIDQIPKPFTPELLRSGVDNAIQTGTIVIKAQRNGSAMPESVEVPHQPILEGNLKEIPLKAILGFLMSSDLNGRLVVETGHDRIKFAIASGKIQAVYSPTVSANRLLELLPEELEVFGSLIPFSLSERRDVSMSGVLSLLENASQTNSRFQALLRFQSAVLTYLALQGSPGMFSFDAHRILPPMFQAFPLRSGFAALAVEGVYRSISETEAALAASTIFGRANLRGFALDQNGFKPNDLAVYSSFDGIQTLSAIADRLNVPFAEAAAVALGLEMTGHVERRNPFALNSVLVLEDDVETSKAMKAVFEAETDRFRVRFVRDRIAAKLLLKRTKFQLIVLPVERSEQENYFLGLKDITGSDTKFIAIVDPSQTERIGGLRNKGVHAVMKRPVIEHEFRGLVYEILEQVEPVEA